MTHAQSAQTALDKLIEAVEAGEPGEFRKANRAAFSTPCQDIALQLREEHCRHAYKGSLDAALALHEALLPGWKYQLSNDLLQHGGPCEPAAVWDGMNCYSGGFPDEAVSQPGRAWLLAVLKAYRGTK